jgi:hypothetical protein
VVGRDCALDLLLDDLKEDLRGRPIELVKAGEGFSLHTRPAFGPALRVAFDVPANARRLTRLEAGVLMAVAYFRCAFPPMSEYNLRCSNANSDWRAALQRRKHHEKIGDAVAQIS